MFHSPRKPRLARILLLAAPLLLLAPCAFAQTQNPNVTISESLSSIPQNAAINLLDLGAAAKSGLDSTAPIVFANGGGTISFNDTATYSSPPSGLYSGSVSGTAAAPWTAAGADKANYLAAEPNSSVSMNFNSEQKYFGVLWGSVDQYNSLSFYDNGKLVDTVSGSQIAANANGNQTAQGSYIVNMDFTNGAAFNQVVATSTSPAFEFDSVAYSAQAVAITPAAIKAAGDQGSTNIVAAAPAPMPAPGASLLGLVLLLAGATWLVRRGPGLAMA